MFTYRRHCMFMSLCHWDLYIVYTKRFHVFDIMNACASWFLMRYVMSRYPDSCVNIPLAMEMNAEAVMESHSYWGYRLKICYDPELAARKRGTCHSLFIRQIGWMEENSQNRMFFFEFIQVNGKRGNLRLVLVFSSWHNRQRSMRNW